jgi:ferredoxin
MRIDRVWIEDGCIRCGWCQHLEPRVFQVTETGSVVIAEARTDRRTDGNQRRRSRLRPDALDAAAVDFLQFIADGCPVQVIKVSGEGNVDAVTGLATPDDAVRVG